MWTRHVALLLLTLTPAPAGAASIVQSINFHLAEHGAGWGTYRRFDPALGTLARVDVAVSGTATSDRFTFGAGPLAAPLSFAGFAGIRFETLLGAATVDVRSTFSATAPAGSSYSGTWSASGPFARSASYAPGDLPFAAFVGPGTLAPDVYESGVRAAFAPSASYAGADSPAVSWAGSGGAFQAIDGTETVVYTYELAATPAPEPPSWVLAVIAAAAGGGMALARLGGTPLRSRLHRRLLAPHRG